VVRRKSSKAKRARRWLYSEKLGCAWTSFGWSMANLSCELFRLIYPRQYVHLRYEDLVRAPVEVVQVLLTRAAPGLCWDGKFSGSNNRHQLYGNTVRYRPPSIENIEEDLRWKNEMPPDHARLILHLTSLLRSRYGY
jgi:hypothetical protein